MRHRAGYDVWVAALVLVAVMSLAGWAAREPATCVIRSEPARTLNLAVALDREHLSRDLADIGRTSRRVMGAIDDPGAQQARADACDAALLEQLMTLHGVTADQIRAVR